MYLCIVKNMIEEDLAKFIDEYHKTSYLNCISDVAVNVDKAISEVNKHMKFIFECAKNEIKIINHAKNTTEQILGILESSEDNIRQIRHKFINCYHLWLSDCATNVILPDNQTKINVSKIKHEIIIDLEDDDDPDGDIEIVKVLERPPDADIQIVNEVKYHNPEDSNNLYGEHEEWDQTQASHFQPSASQGNFIQDDRGRQYQPSDHSQVCNGFMQDSHGRHYQSSDLCDKSLGEFEYVDSKERLSLKLAKSNSNKQCDTQGKSSAESSQKINNSILENLKLEENNCETSQGNQDYSNLNSRDKLNLECYVRLEHLSDQILNESTTSEKKSTLSAEDKFMRLIDLSSLEKKSNKRSRSCSESSVNSTSSLSSKKSHTKKTRTKKQKICSSDSDSSYYESSDNSDTDDEYSYKTFDQSCREEMDDIEREAKRQMLEDSDSESSDEPKDSDDEEQNCQNNKKLTKKGSKSSSKQKKDRPAWKNDPLLNFKLSNDDSREKTNHKDNSDLESPNSNDETSESILNKEKEKRRRRIRIVEPESSDSSSSEDSQIIDNHFKDLDQSKLDQSTASEIATPNKKTGRRNIRKVLDDQEITENTKQAVKDEEGRLERLTSRKEEMCLLALPEASTKNNLTLDVDKETRRVLVAVDRGLVKLLKPHQKDGVRFMWDSCFESLEQVKTQRGSGCILAHCMGLGKTLQIITLVHTLLTNPNIPIENVMIVCPMNTIVNWMDEFSMWLKHAERNRNIKRIELTQAQKMQKRIKRLQAWQKDGGVLIISYEMLRSLTSDKKKTPEEVEELRNLLLNPGADLVVCDEGHLLKNKQSQLANRIQQVETQRRIILTGTPLQNNLDEYHCMVQFVKPNLLGSKAEFDNRFANPIKNGQFEDSTEHDVRLMKYRAHALHRMLEGCVQRNDYAVLKPYLPPKQEYVISVRLSEKQTSMYQHYITNIAKVSDKHCSLFKNYQEIKRLLAHPKTLQLKELHPKRTKKSEQAEGNEPAEFWWSSFVQERDLEDISISSKLILLFGLLEDCAKKQDKMLVFSQCLYSLDLIEKFLKKLDTGDDGTDESEASLSFKGEWKRGYDYLRIDGNVRAEERSNLCKMFNDPTDKRLRLFLISTKAGGLGINLTGANRVVVFDPSWNPSSDLQSIFRVFRFGQEKPCYVYRFLTAGTMEEKIYNRQVTKLCLSLRVVDEQQTGRHYRDSDLMELYKLEPLPDGPTTLAKPKDDVLADVLSKYGKYVYNFHEHDSLLVNQEEEQLNEEERNQAWLEYQQEAQGTQTKAQANTASKEDSAVDVNSETSSNCD